ncbi:MAG: triose-phosphate isomerase [Eubacteriales bacterium]|nr:triose-phosphate isomerase [Eubacteriales bacterium]
MGLTERKPVIAGNWKMNKTKAETREFVEAFKAMDLDEGVEKILIAPYTDLDTLVEGLAGTDIGAGAENVHYEGSGAFTGEVSLDMLKEIGVGYCVVGHSERRQYFGETNKTCALKLKKIFADSDIVPILCVGEKLQVREHGRENEFVGEQVEEALLGLTVEDVRKMIIAYEPIWAIGTGETATDEQAEDMCAVIRKKVYGMFGAETAAVVRIQYGGSVKPENIKGLMAQEDIDGALVGGASLEPASFEKIVDYNRE